MTNWRRWHRWLGTVAALLLVLIGATGILLQLDEVTEFTAPPRPTPVNWSQLAPIDVKALAGRVSALADQRSGANDILSLDLTTSDKGPIAVVRFSDGKAPVTLDLQTGKEHKAVDPSRPKNGLLQKIRRLVLNLHTFGLVGPAGHILGAAVSAMLLFLGSSGLWMWWLMRQERIKRNKGSWFWR